jgi:hypothetical protein
LPLPTRTQVAALSVSAATAVASLTPVIGVVAVLSEVVLPVPRKPPVFEPQQRTVPFEIRAHE